MSIPVHLLLLGSIVLVAYHGAPIRNAQAQSPTDVWEKVLAAKGGRDRLLQVRSFAWASDSGPGSAGSERYQFVMMLPDRYWSWEDHRPGRMGFGAEVWNAVTKQHWMGRNGGPASVVSWDGPTERARLRMRRENQLVFLLETSFVAPTVHRATAAAGDRIELDGTAPGFASLKYLIDRRSYLPVRITLTPELPVAGSNKTTIGVPVTYDIAAYASYGGLQLPSQIAGLGTLTYVVNPDLNPKLFETPPNGVTSGNAWREFLKR